MIRQLYINRVNMPRNLNPPIGNRVTRNQLAVIRL